MAKYKFYEFSNPKHWCGTAIGENEEDAIKKFAEEVLPNHSIEESITFIKSKYLFKLVK